VDQLDAAAVEGAEVSLEEDRWRSIHPFGPIAVSTGDAPGDDLTLLGRGEGSKHPAPGLTAALSPDQLLFL
jgi:hypothetical protein